MKTAQFLKSLRNQCGMLAPILLVVVVIVVIAAAGGGYFFINIVNKPAQIKSLVEPIENSFLTYSQAVKAIEDDLKDTSSGSDADSIERAILRSKGLIKTANDDLANLSPNVNKLNVSDTADYYKNLNNYVEESKKLTQINQDNTDAAGKLAPIIRQYQEEAASLSGISNYMYSNPSKYIQIVNDFITKENQMIKNAQAINTQGQAKQTVDSLAKKMILERDFLQSIIDAVKNRDDAAIVTAQKDYAQKVIDWESESNRISDSHKEETRTMSQDLDSLSEKIKSAYSDLKIKFKF